MHRRRNIVLLIAFLAGCLSYAQRGVRIGYVDMNIILESVEEYQTSNQLLEEKIKEWRKEIELKKIQLEQFQEQFALERILLTPELIEERELEIQDFAAQLVNLQEKYFGPNGTMMRQRTQLLKPIQDNILNIVRQIAQERKYDIIFDRSSEGIMLYSSKNYDISDLVIKRINRQQRIKKNQERIESLKSNINNLKN